MARTAERRPGGGGVPDGGEHVPTSITTTGCPCGCQTVPPWSDDPACIRHRRTARGLADALDHLDELGLCACWTAQRRHQRAA